MVDNEILGGLISALQRGESLKRAMMTMFNAGYKKELIEEAARSLSKQVIETQAEPKSSGKNAKYKIPITPEPEKRQTTPPKPPKEMPTLKPAQKPQKEIHILKPVQKTQPKVSAYGIQPVINKQPPKPVQKVSVYEEKQQSRDKKIIVVLFAILILLIIALTSIFLFKQQLIDFFSKFLG